MIAHLPAVHGSSQGRSRVRHRNRLRTVFLHRRDETIASFGERLYECRILGWVTKGGTKLSHRRVEANIGIDLRIGAPEFRLQLLSRH